MSALFYCCKALEKSIVIRRRGMVVEEKSFVACCQMQVLDDRFRLVYGLLVHSSYYFSIPLALKYPHTHSISWF